MSTHLRGRVDFRVDRSSDTVGGAGLPSARSRGSVVSLTPATAVDTLGEAIAELAARLHAATYELLVLLREFDDATGWNNGFASCAHWFHWRTGIDLGAAREKVRVAHALARLPQVSAALQRGEISYATVRALSSVATPATDAQLLDLAYAGTTAHVERLVRAWRRCDRVRPRTRSADICIASSSPGCTTTACWCSAAASRPSSAPSCSERWRPRRSAYGRPRARSPPRRRRTR